MAATTDDLSGLRDHALISVGFVTLCRRGELVALKFEDIEPNYLGTARQSVTQKMIPKGLGALRI